MLLKMVEPIDVVNGKYERGKRGGFRSFGLVLLK
jgi:hypothetical protein